MGELQPENREADEQNEDREGGMQCKTPTYTETEMYQQKGKKKKKDLARWKVLQYLR